MRDKLTGLEKKWIFYDVANSAFTMLVSTLIPIYFNSLAETEGLSDAQYLAYWGYALSIATLLVIFAGPLLGAVADRGRRKRGILASSVVAGALFCASLGFAQSWLLYLALFVVAKVLYSLSLIFYDSMLADVTTEERMDEVSARGYAWGYIGSCVPFICCLLLVLLHDRIGITMSAAMALAFIITALWWLLGSMPLLRSYRQVHFLQLHEIRTNVFSQLGHTIREMFSDMKILLFVLAFFFYIDGVYTIIDMSSAYGTSVGLASTDLLLALLVTQFVAFPCAIIFGRLSRVKPLPFLITVCIVAYFFIAVYAVFLEQAYQFWILAICVGMFQGGIQALSRSYFTKIIPAEKSGEYFSLLDICGKGASFLGTMVVSAMTLLTGHQQLGVACIAVFFIVGLVLFRSSVKAAPGCADTRGGAA